MQVIDKSASYSESRVLRNVLLLCLKLTGRQRWDRRSEKMGGERLSQPQCHCSLSSSKQLQPPYSCQCSVSLLYWKWFIIYADWTSAYQWLNLNWHNRKQHVNTEHCWETRRSFCLLVRSGLMWHQKIHELEIYAIIKLAVNQVSNEAVKI